MSKNQKPDGGLAFPQLSIESGKRDGHDDLVEPITATLGGMALRQWYAGMALQGLAVGCSGMLGDQSSAYANGYCNKALADRAFALADAMLRAEADHG